MTGDRQIEVLRAIVHDYVHTREPVGSQAIAKRHDLGVSPATIRNDMAALEEAGLITQPHTSAGRIPTDAGYRFFVDQLDVLRKPLSIAERKAIAQFVGGGVDLDDTLERTVRLLAQLTHHVAVAKYPTLRRSSLRHVEVVPASTTRVLVVIISDTGRVEQRSVERDESLTEDLIAELRARVNAAGVGRRMPELAHDLQDIVTAFPPTDRPTVQRIIDAIVEALQQDVEERIVLAGTANLARSNIDFSRSITPVLEALEEQVVLLRLLSEMDAGEPVAVRIGSETQMDELSETAVIAGRYGDGAAGMLGQLGVLGPTRMDYESTMAAVHAVSRYLSKALG